MSRMIEVSAADLEGAALDWAVAEATGLSAWTEDGLIGGVIVMVPEDRHDPEGPRKGFFPSAGWRDGGPLIDRYQVWLHGPLPAKPVNRNCWQASVGPNTESHDGPTALIAAMRAIVAAELGDTVDVPAELVEAS